MNDWNKALKDIEEITEKLKCHPLKKTHTEHNTTLEECITSITIKDDNLIQIKGMTTYHPEKSYGWITGYPKSDHEPNDFKYIDFSSFIKTFQWGKEAKK